MNYEIKTEIYRAMVLLGAEHDLLCTIGSWGDTMNDEQTLSGLEEWNKGTLGEIRGRIEHYESSAPQKVCIHDEGQ